MRRLKAAGVSSAVTVDAAEFTVSFGETTAYLGNVFEEYRHYHREDSRKRSMRHRRRKGAAPKAEANALKMKLMLERTRQRIEAAMAKLPPGVRAKITKVAKLTGLHRDTVEKYLNIICK